MSKIISQNEQDAKQISDSVKNIFDRFQVSRLLKASNIWKKKGESPVNVMKYAFSLVFRNRSMYMDMLLGNDVVSFSKDTHYRFMNSIHANWIRFTSLLASRISTNLIAPATSVDRVNALIVDDSIFPMGRSKKSNF